MSYYLDKYLHNILGFHAASLVHSICVCWEATGVRVGCNECWELIYEKRP